MVERLLVVVVAWCCAIVLPGCGPQDVRAAPELAAEVAASWASRDEDGFLASFDGAAHPRARQLWQSTSGVRIISVIPVDEQQWQIIWGDPEARATTLSVVRPVLDCDRGCTLVDLVQSPDQPTPIWVVGQVTGTTESGAVILDATGGQRIPSLVAAARSRLARSGIELLDPDVPVLVEVPGTVEQFERMMAAPALDFRYSGGLTWTAGSPTTPALQHIVLNPQITDTADDAQLTHLITHEMVHATTAHLRVGVDRKWVSEGLAEHLSLPADPRAQQASNDLLVQMCPLAVTVVADSDFASGDPARAYAWSNWAVGRIMATDPAILGELWQGDRPVPEFDDSPICG